MASLSNTCRSLALVLFSPLLLASYGTIDARTHALFRTFLSLCCWRENLTIHESPTANELRERIAARMRGGRSDDQIKSELIGEYGKRILALPEGVARTWLFLTPIAALVLGLILAVFFLRRVSARVAPALVEDGRDDALLH